MGDEEPDGLDANLLAEKWAVYIYFLYVDIEGIIQIILAF
jgi:hypothetical protein